MNVGDIFWVNLPSPGGRAQSGKRPAIVFQHSKVSQKIPTVLIVPLTTQQDALRFPATVFIEKSSKNGLRQDSVALVFQLTAIDKRFFDTRLEKISENDLKEIWQNLVSLAGQS